MVYTLCMRKSKTKKMDFYMNRAKLVIHDEYFRVRDDAFS